MAKHNLCTEIARHSEAIAAFELEPNVAAIATRLGELPVLDQHMVFAWLAGVYPGLAVRVRAQGEAPAVGPCHCPECGDYESADRPWKPFNER